MMQYVDVVYFYLFFSRYPVKSMKHVDEGRRTDYSNITIVSHWDLTAVAHPTSKIILKVV